jgi:hypothetical protein
LPQEKPSQNMCSIRFPKRGSAAKYPATHNLVNDLVHFPNLIHRSSAFFAPRSCQTTQGEFFFNHHCRTRPKFHTALQFSQIEPRRNFLWDGQVAGITCVASYRRIDTSRQTFLMPGRSFRISHMSDVNDQIRDLPRKMLFSMSDSVQPLLRFIHRPSLSVNQVWASEHAFHVTGIIVHMVSTSG